jgi:hypothetical protein
MAEYTRKKLAEPFDPMDIEWRIQQSGEKNGKKWAMVLAYITNRAIMERLDEVFGIAGWQNNFEPLPDGGAICGISAKINSEWITKYDGADKTQIEAVKGGLSSAMKRAAVQWGMGRYLYNLPTTFVQLLDQEPLHGDYETVYIKALGGKHYFMRPQLPGWATPMGAGGKPTKSPRKPLASGYNQKSMRELSKTNSQGGQDVEDN